MKKNIEWKKTAKTIGIVAFIFIFISLFLTPVINLTYKYIPENENTLLPTGECLYLWGLFLEIKEGDIVAFSLATNIEKFPIETTPLIIISSLLTIIGIILIRIEKNAQKTKRIYQVLMLILGGIIGLYSMIRITLFGIINFQSSEYFKFDFGFYSGYIIFLTSLTLGIINWINKKKISEDSDNKREEFFDYGFFGSSTD